MVKGFHGGVWLELMKKPACDRPVEVLPAPKMIRLPLAQHAGEPSRPLVGVGEHVLLGQPVAEAGEGASCGLHSPVSGTVKAVGEYHPPEGGACGLLQIENDGEDRVLGDTREQDTDALSKDRILSIVRNAAIVSVDGSAAPLWYRLSQFTARQVRTLVVNAVETEPYLCASQKLIGENPDDVAKGLQLALRCTGAKEAVLAVSDDIDPETVGDMVKCAHLQGVELKLERVYQKYPSGNEKYLRRMLFGDRAGEDCGFLYAEECVNISRAAQFGFPQITKVVTVAGGAVGNPQNVEARVGTPVRALLDHCGLIYDPEQVVIGGAMRGTAVTDLNIAVTKTTSGVLALMTERSGVRHPMCINCGKCVRVCPERLMPNYIAMKAVLADFDACEALHIDSCIECGACAYICPGHMPIVELIKNIKKAARAGGGGQE